jgi:hypothetical protein
VRRRRRYCAPLQHCRHASGQRVTLSLCGSRYVSSEVSERGDKVTAPAVRAESNVLAEFTRRAGAPPAGVRFADDGDLILIQVAAERAPLERTYLARLDADARAVGLRGALLGRY